jgi:hypothetical protein
MKIRTPHLPVLCRSASRIEIALTTATRKPVGNQLTHKLESEVPMGMGRPKALLVLDAEQRGQLEGFAR